MVKFIKKIWCPIVLAAVLLAFLALSLCGDAIHSPAYVACWLDGGSGQLDTRILRDVRLHFPHWSKEERLEYLTKVYPHTDAHATEILLESAAEWDLLFPWDEYAKTLNDSDLGGKDVNDLRQLIGMMILHTHCQMKMIREQESGRWFVMIANAKTKKITHLETHFTGDKEPELMFYSSVIELNREQPDRMKFRYDALSATWHILPAQK